MESKKNTHVQQYLEIALREKNFPSDDVRLSVRFGSLTHARLAYWAKDLGLSRSGLAADLVEAALRDLEEASGMLESPEVYQAYYDVFSKVDVEEENE